MSDLSYSQRLLIDELARQEAIMDSRLNRLERATDPDSPSAVADRKLAARSEDRCSDLTRALAVLRRAVAKADSIE